MSVQVRRRREAASFLSTYVGAQGELLVDTTNNRLQVHDGATPGGWPAARLADVIGRTAVVDASYTALSSDRTVAFTALTAARAVTLPPAAAFPTGTALTIVDESGACSGTRPITVTRAGTDTINGLSSAALVTPYGFLALQSNGTARWTVVDQALVPNRKTFTDVAMDNGTTAYSSNFTRLPLSIVNQDTGGNWSAANYWYTCPRAGVYQIAASMRVGPSGTTSSYASAQFGIGVYTSEADGAWFLWHFTPPSGASASRVTYPYARLSYQNAGDQLRMFTYSDYSGGVVVYRAGLQICLVSDAV